MRIRQVQDGELTKSTMSCYPKMFTFAVLGFSVAVWQMSWHLHSSIKFFKALNCRKSNSTEQFGLPFILEHFLAKSART